MTSNAVRRLGGQAVRATLALVSLTAYPPNRLSAQDSLPIGFGTLKRDDIIVRFDTPELEIQLLPLEESVTRLLAPDTYRSLQDLVRSKRAVVDDLARRAGVLRPVLAMVSFFGLVPQARFVPEDVNITSRGRLFRPVGIVPLSPKWASYQLDAREQAVAIYLFEEGISFRETLTVSYQGLANDSWSRAILTLERERARVMARAQSRPNP